jgi:CRISPR/Cas system CSM-associated protein Csm3 (group 7 of RAMP superfamily)
MIKIKKFKVELETLEPLKIGGVEDPLSGIHNPVATVGKNLCIPGSTLKGALRNEIENFLIDKYYDKASKKWQSDKLPLQPCIPAPKFTADEEILIKDSKYRNYACHYPCYKRPCPSHREGSLKECKEKKCLPDTHISHEICPVCYLMGTMGLIGFVRVPFLFTDISANELYAARIDRAVKSVVEGTNRPYQLVPNGTKFIGELQIIIEDTVLGWKLGEPRPLLKNETKGDKWLEGITLTQDQIIEDYILDRLKAINLLGGYKSKGFGQIKITVSG